MFHVVSWVSSWVVLVFWLGFGLFVFCVCVVLKTPSFLLSPILQHEGIANQRQNVLMTVRASSAHGMSSKKNVDSSRRADPGDIQGRRCFEIDIG